MIHLTKIITCLLLALSFSTPQVFASKKKTLTMKKQIYIKKGVFACLTKTYYDRLSSGVAAKDMNLAKSMINERKCVITSNAFQASILEYGMLKSHVKVYTHKGSVNLWVATEFLFNK